MENNDLREEATFERGSVDASKVSISFGAKHGLLSDGMRQI